MSRKWFDTILCAIFYTNCDIPTYRDKFWEVRQMVDEWSKNMVEQFTPSWVSCLDESMSPWTNKYTCPGWMFVPRKPHLFGNEYHSVCCSMSGIMWGWSLWKEKMLLVQESIQNQNTTTLETLWVYCCEFWNSFLEEAPLLYWIAASVS